MYKSLHVSANVHLKAVLYHDVFCKYSVRSFMCLSSVKMRLCFVIIYAWFEWNRPVFALNIVPRWVR